MPAITNLILNGEPHEHLGTGSVEALLREIGADPGRVAAMINDTVIRRSDFGTARLHDGDRVEVLTYAGGG